MNIATVWGKRYARPSVKVWRRKRAKGTAKSMNKSLIKKHAAKVASE